jgi:basic membrane lipoprotein Med (substrate-binding protein (PBP1-ABC) superfamily)
MKRFIGMVVALIGIATLVFGIIFIIQSNTGKQTVADEVKPIALSDVNPKYDAVSASQTQLMAAEEPKIQSGQAQPSAMYNYLSAQRALLGLAKANIGLTGFVMMSGSVDIILGIALILMGMTLFMKQTA